jgi:DNA-binding CsgD family transcriptional regulator
VPPFPVIPARPDIPLAAEMTLLAEVFVHALHGDLRKAESLAEQAHRNRTEWPTMRSTWAVSRASLATSAGRLGDARRLLREARPAHPFAQLCVLTYVEALLGNNARSLLDEAEQLAPEGQRPQRYGLWIARIWAGGVSPFEAVADVRAHGELAAEALLLHEAVRLGHADRALERLRELAATTTGLLVPVYAAHAEALVRNDSDALMDVAARFEEAGMMLHAAEAAAASGNRALYGRLVSMCQGARTPALISVPALTRREREIAVLAARGLTNKEIASTLVISVRTVDNHLSNAYAKLGIAARGELALALMDDSG